MRKLAIAGVLLAASLAAPVTAAHAETDKLLNVSYDIARELYAALNPAFIADWKAKTGHDLTIDQSHAGSTKQANAIIEGLQADVVTFNQVTDVQVLHDRGNLIPANWQQRLPNNSSPYYSLPAFLVRAGNPKGIHNWGDLVKDGVEVIFPNPKTSGNARYTYLAATAWAREEYKGDETKVENYIKALFDHVPVFDTGGRGATTTFVEREIGDVLITFEAEVNTTRDLYGADKFEVVVPPVSLLAEFPVTVVDSVVDKRGSRAEAEAYLNFLYSDPAQEILAKFYNRVHSPAVVEEHKDQFPPVRLVTVEDTFGGWDQATKDHFAKGALLDQLFGNR
ncbi:thiosulfate ABC transporter substrate-binding protein CysP [Radicibacter daui]|uniref:thiosulfate ABC transporter substrate-binding protein CysP n=1 Tax=Radicibacter daui TaxID=3064829 RepID=UPI004046C22D